MPLEPQTEDIKDVQLATTGTFNASTGKVKFTRQDFDDMVDAAKELAGKVDFPLKLGHNEGQELLQEDGLPAAGWIENLRRQGNTLVADFMRVPEKIATIMKGGGLRKRSIEAARNLELAGQRFKFVLTSVALLGEELPAVDSLDDIAALYTAAKLDWPDTEDEEATTVVFIAAAVHEDDDDDEVEDMIRELQRIIGRGDSLVRGRKGGPRLRHMLEGAISEIRRVAKGTKAKIGEIIDMDKLSRQAIVELLGLDEEVEDDAIATAIKDLQGKVKAGEKGGANDGDGNDKDGDNAEMAEIKKTMEHQAEEILDLKNDKALTAATDAAHAAIKASKFAPAVEPELVKMALGDPKGFQEYVKKTPVIAGMTTGVIGSSEDPETADLSEYEPHADQIKMMAQTGVTREEFILQGIKDAEAIAEKELVSAKIKASLAPTKAD